MEDHPGGLAKRRFEALLRESDQVQGSISRTLTAAHNTIGIFIPATLGVFALTAKALETSDKIDLLALVLAGIFCMARLYADSLWVEFLSYHHYFFGELQPRIYAAAGQTGKPNLGQFVVNRWARRNGPHLVAPHVASFLLVAPLTIYGVWAYSVGTRRVVFLVSIGVLLSAALLSSLRAALLSRTVYRDLGMGKYGTEEIPELTPGLRVGPQNTAPQADG
jgi:hypothetical protein